MTATRSRPRSRNRPVEPKFAARRRQVARSRRYRRLWAVGALTMLASLGLGAIAAANSPWFDVEAVEVVGVTRANPQHIVTASGIERGQPLVDIDPERVVADVSLVPYIGTVDVARQWQGTVRITVTERIGVAMLQAGSKWVLVDVTGRQLELLDVAPEVSVPIEGVEASGVPGQQVSVEAQGAVDVLMAMGPDLAAASRAIVHDDAEGLTVELAAGGRVVMGDAADLDAKLVATQTMLTQVDLTCLDRIDVRVPSAPTLRRLAATDGEEPGGEAGGC
ncbi:MAG: FtsQ-type POTRA domain-containing protein [Actinomycetota bacterium]